MPRNIVRHYLFCICLGAGIAHNLSAQPQMPPPPQRADVETMLSDRPDGVSDRPLNVVLLAGPKDHGLNEHDYPLWQKRWKVLLGGLQDDDEPILNIFGAALPASESDLAGAENISLHTAWIRLTEDQWQSADLVVAYCAPQWDATAINQLRKFLQRGGGLVIMHMALWQDSPELAALIGAAYQPATQFRHGPVHLELASSDQAICAGLPREINLVDESYFNFQGDLSDAQVLATSRETRHGETRSRDEPMFWAVDRSPGRVFVCIPGHYMWTFDDPIFRLLLLRGMAWAANEHVARFEPLVLRGARIAEPTSDAPVVPETPVPDDAELLLWLDASDRSTLSLDQETLVAAWRSKASLVPSEVTATAEQRPRLEPDALNGHPVVRFDGKDDFLINRQFGQSTSQWTMFLVVVPRSNQGSGVPAGFHGFFSANQPQQRDFETGLNVDMGAVQTDRFWCLNVEGASGGGATNLIFSATDFGKPRVLAITSNNQQTTVLAESIPQLARAASDTTTSLSEIRVGARYYLPNQETGFVHADMAEILLYRTSLPVERIKAISKYLETKYDVAPPTLKATQYTLEDALTALQRFDWGNTREALRPIDAVIQSGNPAEVRQLESQLIAALEQQLTAGATDFVCRRLAMIGSETAVPCLIRLLDDPARANSAIFALQRMQVAGTETELVRQLTTSAGTKRLAIIYGLGGALDQETVDELLRLLADQDPLVARSAAVMLTEIGDRRAIAALSRSPSGSPALRRRLASKLMQRLEKEAARDIYQQLENSPEIADRATALAGLVSLDPQGSLPALLAALQGTNLRLAGQAGGLLAHRCPESVAKGVVAAFPTLPADSQRILLGVRWSRLPAIGRVLAHSAITSQEADNRLSALRLLAEHGTAEDIGLLCRVAVNDRQPQVRQAAEESLQHLAATDVDTTIRQQLATATPDELPILIRTVRQRRIPNAAAAILLLAAHQQATVRLEALKTLEERGDASLIAPLVSLLLQTTDNGEQAAAERALWQSALRTPQQGAATTPLLSAYRRLTTPEDRAKLLPVLGRMGGPQIRDLITEAETDANSAVRTAAIRAISNWPDASVAEHLLTIVRDSNEPGHRVWSLRGYIRIITLPGGPSPEQTFQRLQPAWKLAQRDEERRFLLQRLDAVPCADSLRFVMSQLNDRDLQAEAIATTASLSERLLESDPELCRTAIRSILQVTDDPVLHSRLSRHLLETP